MGAIVKEKVKGSGEWWVFINHKGMRKSKKCGPGARGKNLAEHLAKLVESNLMLGRPLMGKEEKPPTPTLAQYYERFKKTYMEATMKETTFDSYDSNFRVHILPVLGSYRLDQIDNMKMEDFVTGLLKKKVFLKPDKTLSKRSIQLALCSIGVLFREAVRHKLVSENPTRGLGRYYRGADATKVVDPLNREESLLLLRTALDNYPEDYPVLLCGLHTGMRSGEIGALQWPDIDWNGRFIAVRRAIVRGSITTVKTKHGNRRVDCSDELLEVLGKLRKLRLEEALRRGQPNIPEWVFLTRYGEVDGHGNYKRLTLKRTLKKAGLRDIRFHDLRHTFASQLLAQGEPVTYVSNQLGHASPHITWQVYAHWVPNKSQRQAVNRLPSLKQEGQSR